MKNFPCCLAVYLSCLLAAGCSTSSRTSESDSTKADSTKLDSDGPNKADDSISGRWTAHLESPGGKLLFELDFSKVSDQWKTTVINGKEVIPVDQVQFNHRELTIGFPHYDSKIVASLNSENRLVGKWKKVVGKDKTDEMNFFAEKKTRAYSSSDAGSVAGKYSVTFSSSDDLAVGLFKKSDDQILGTFLTTTGDYRFLAGDFDEATRRLTLSCFDGGHAFLFTATLDQTGNLSGDFWSRGNWHETWTGKKDSAATIADGFEQVKWQGVSLNEISFPNLEGKLQALDDKEFDGKVKIVQVFGSWCPNCHDASLLLNQLQKEYGDRGLSIIGLAFELTGDFERDKLQIERYKQRTGATYPILIAGLSDKKKAAEKLKLLNEVKSYPTSIFLDSDNNPIAIHSGFTGPATGEAYTQLQGKFRKIIEEAIEKNVSKKNVSKKSQSTEK